MAVATESEKTTLRFICPQCRTHYFRPMAECDFCPGSVPVETRVTPSRDQFGRVKVQR